MEEKQCTNLVAEFVKLQTHRSNLKVDNISFIVVGQQIVSYTW
jgi:hypothetical protein